MRIVQNARPRKGTGAAVYARVGRTSDARSDYLVS